MVNTSFQPPIALYVMISPVSYCGRKSFMLSLHCHDLYLGHVSCGRPLSTNEQCEKSKFKRSVPVSSDLRQPGLIFWSFARD